MNARPRLAVRLLVALAVLRWRHRFTRADLHKPTGGRVGPVTDGVAPVRRDVPASELVVSAAEWVWRKRVCDAAEAVVWGPSAEAVTAVRQVLAERPVEL